jgi:hypothetical protein
MKRKNGLFFWGSLVVLGVYQNELHLPYNMAGLEIAEFRNSRQCKSLLIKSIKKLFSSKIQVKGK